MNRNKRSFSIIMTVYDQAPELRENLPLFLTQEYEPGYEVIVVDETSTDDTSDMLKLLKEDYPHLYTTFLPKPNRLLIRKKMAINIGIKAAKYDWLIIANISPKPWATDILQAIDEVTDEQADLTLGYFTKKGMTLQTFADYNDARYHLLKSERRLKKVVERKHLKFVLGRYDFIMIRKDQAHEILKYYEQKTPTTTLLGYRLRIIWKNLLAHESTTHLFKS
jgi:glycosyltransferase involved in cell wall biosynthesis